jgi:hypothetical protein
VGQYRLVFDAGAQWDWRVALIPAAMAVAATVVPFVILRLRGGKATLMTRLVYLVPVMAWLLCGLAVTSMYSQHRRAADALERGGAQVVEGPVEHFQQGIKDESFDVGGVHFQYADGIIVPGFHHQAINGGPMREGLPVRIHYVPRRINWGGPYILRLEIAD